MLGFMTIGFLVQRTAFIGRVFALTISTSRRDIHGLCAYLYAVAFLTLHAPRGSVTVNFIMTKS